MDTKITLVSPSPIHKNAVLSYRAEFLKNGEDMDGSAYLRDADSYEHWLDILARLSDPVQVPPPLRPSSTYLGYLDSELVGMLTIRWQMNDFLEKYAGNIGYSVRKSRRGNGYAADMLRLAMDKCRKYGMSRLILTCFPDNIPSEKTILRCGGVYLETVRYKDMFTLKRFEIHL